MTPEQRHLLIGSGWCVLCVSYLMVCATAFFYAHAFWMLGRREYLDWRDKRREVAELKKMTGVPDQRDALDRAARLKAES